MKATLRLAAAALLYLSFNGAALAVPSYARQTGQECAACHVGSFGPQLTPYGIKFKIGGYTETDGAGTKIPLSAMLVQSFTHTSRDATEAPAKHFDPNDNFSLQELSAFIAGGFGSHVGSFAQFTWSEPDRKFAFDNIDLRLTQSMQLAGRDAVFGVSLNNNPTVQDPFNTTPSWRFPYLGSELAIAPAASPIIAGGQEMQAVGTTAYAFFDNQWYAEAGAYVPLSSGTLEAMNIEPGDEISGAAPYWRLAYFRDLHKQAFSVGVFGFHPSILPGRIDGPSDKYDDIGVDASYQFLGTREHVFAFNGSFIHEARHFDASFPAGAVSSQDGSLDSINLSGSYHYQKTYGLTLGYFDTEGNHDDALYNTGEPDIGSINGSPDSRGFTVQADWTPLGKEDSWGAPWANLRLGLQYTAYTRFNGASSNYDGFGCDPGDNNTLFTFLWLAF